MNEARFLEVCSIILQKSPETLALNNVMVAEGWDSLANLEFIAEIDDELGVQLDSEALEDCVTFHDLFQLIKSLA